MKATAKDLRLRTKSILGTVARGEEVTITHRGRPCAKIVPVQQARRRRPARDARELPLFGLWRDNPAVEDVGAYVESLRRGRY